MNSIIEKIRGNVFILLIVEAAGVSNKEQMKLLLRYLSKRSFIIECLVGAEDVMETSAIFTLKRYSLILHQAYNRSEDNTMIRQATWMVSSMA